MSLTLTAICVAALCLLIAMRIKRTRDQDEIEQHSITPEALLTLLASNHEVLVFDVRQPLANFFASGVLLLGKKLGPILWQLPPWLPYERERMSAFLKMLPRTSTAASKLAHEHDLKKKDWIAPDAVAKTKIRYAFEPRHESFFTDEFIELLRKHNSALVLADTAGKFPYAEDLTADFVYIRLHGSEGSGSTLTMKPRS